MKWKLVIFLLMATLTFVVQLEDAPPQNNEEAKAEVLDKTTKTEKQTNQEISNSIKIKAKSKRKLKNSSKAKDHQKKTAKNLDSPVKSEEPAANIKAIKKTPVVPDRKLKSKKAKKKLKRFGFKFNQTTLKATSNKLKVARRKLKDTKKLKSQHFRNLLRRFYIRPDQIEHLAGSPDKTVQKTLQNIRNLVQNADHSIWKPVNSRARAEMLRTRKRLDKEIKKQVKSYEKWHKTTWKKIEKVWKQKGSYYIGDDELNREEHEKLYQLFIIENGEKVKFLLPLIDVERKIIESINHRVSDWDNENYVRLAVKLMTKQLFLEYLRRFRTYRKQHKQDYAKDLRALDASYMADYKANQNFDKRVKNIID